ncbi:CD27 antigen-like [Brachyistius frenatus]|uniref:CD27 antigen-like n=1 Tax=Brachyistius frenatus TaxID=100188 RepID=UPI0037E89E19
MKTLCYLAFSLLCSLSLFSGLSIQCNKTQYAWPIESPRFCCNMCPPGQYMIHRSAVICDINCGLCRDDHYIHTYNLDMGCKRCEKCNKPNMERKFNCSSTHDTVCKCKPGYRCEDHTCTVCVVVKPASKSTFPPSTTASTLTTLWVPHKPITDTVGFLVITALLCAGIALLVVTRIKPFLRWIRSNQCYFSAEKSAPPSLYAEDEDVSKPVQEVCGKCDQPIEVCVKD